MLAQRHQPHLGGATTSYTTDGQAVAAASTAASTMPADSVLKNAVGANAATTAQEGAFDALGGGTETKPAAAPSAKCGWLCIAALVAVVYLVARSG